MQSRHHNVDFCVIGGGMSGICAAIAAARRGVKVLLMHDRPVLGGNASSEIRMWICGAKGENNKETGILEEIQLENLYRNPNLNFSIWDSVLYEKVKFEENITLLLNCSCLDATVEDGRITSVKGWQLTSETYHTVYADYFADCSGDSILAPLTNAEFRVGREKREEFGESIAPVMEDKKTMGMSCLFQIRETDCPQLFIPPKWAYHYPNEEKLIYKEHTLDNNFWWIELGGEQDSIHDTEDLRDELLKIAFGIWDHIKNHGNHDAEKWDLEWIGFLPGKRESRRYEGDYILSQKDIDSGGKFEDMVAYGGWPMDDHFPAGFYHEDSYPTIFHPVDSPYGIPYRCLYSKNMKNLFFAGRNISTTHTALSSTRVMGTCSILGQAVGTAAALTKVHNCSPREIYQYHIKELQETLMEDDCYLPGMKKEISRHLKKAVITTNTNTNAENLRNGIDRPVGENQNSVVFHWGDWVDFNFFDLETVSEIKLVFDSDLSLHKRMDCRFELRRPHLRPPENLVKEYEIYAKDRSGEWVLIKEEKNNYQRIVKEKLGVETTGIRVKFNQSWGSLQFQVFSVYLK